MEPTLKSLTEYACNLEYEGLSPDLIEHCKYRILDTMGCALAAFDAEPSVIARKIAMRASVEDGATVLGTSHRTLPELAGFSNAVMTRYIEGNDTYPGGGGHPSDIILPVLAVAESAGADPRKAILGIVIGYEIYRYIYRSYPTRAVGIDHGIYTAVSTGAAVAKVLGLSFEQTANAISLALTPNIPLEVTRRDHLSMWKGCAAANAARNGAFAALLSQQGMTGPERPFEGSHGFAEIARREVAMPMPGAPPDGIAKADYKCFLMEFHAQAPTAAALQLYKEMPVDKIKSIVVNTYWLTYSEIGSSPANWRPKTRETADHSLPYILGAVLVDGKFSDDIFREERMDDPRILAIADKISVVEDPELTKAFPENCTCRMDITTTDGEKRVIVIANPPGHHNAPMAFSELKAKFRGLAGRKLKPDALELLADHILKFDTSSSVRELFERAAI